VEAIGGEVTKESKVRNNCAKHDVSIMMNMKGGTGIPFTAEIAYLGNRDMKYFVPQRWCSARNSAK